MPPTRILKEIFKICPCSYEYDIRYYTLLTNIAKIKCLVILVPQSNRKYSSYREVVVCQRYLLSNELFTQSKSIEFFCSAVSEVYLYDQWVGDGRFDPGSLC